MKICGRSFWRKSSAFDVNKLTKVGCGITFLYEAAIWKEMASSAYEARAEEELEIGKKR